MKRVCKRSIAVLILVAVGVLWVATIGPGGGCEVGIGRYSVEQLAVNVLLSYAALLLGYLVLGRAAWKRRVARVVLNVSAILFALLLVESPAMLGLLDYRAVLFRDLAPGAGPDHLRLDPELVFRHPPYGHFEHFASKQPGRPMLDHATAGGPQKIEYRYDKNGFRNPHDLQGAAVVLIGDSFVEGFLVPQRQTCAAELGRMLGVDVANLGHDDYGPPQELVVLRKYALNLRPRVIAWFFFEGNDLIDLEDFRTATTGWRGRLTRGNSFAARSFCLNALDRVDRWLEPFRWRDPGLRRETPARLLPEIRDDQVTMRFGGYFGWGSREISPRELGLLAKVQEVLREAKATCDRHGIELLLISVPTKFRVYRDLCVPPLAPHQARWQLNDLPDRLGRWCAAAGIEYLDLTPRLKSAARRGPLVYYPNDGHWTAAGHAVVAEEVAEFIRKLGWLDSGQP